MPKEYIEREVALNKIKKLQKTDPATVGKKQFSEGYFCGLYEAEIVLLQTPTADVVEVVRCKDCIYFQPNYVLTNDGERRPYTDKEKEHDFGIVNMEKGINCGSRCERYEKWEENNIPVWCNENDFCSYGKRGD